MDLMFFLEDNVGALSIVKNNGSVELLEKTNSYNKKNVKNLLLRAFGTVDLVNRKKYNKVVNSFIKKAEKRGYIHWSVS